MKRKNHFVLAAPITISIGALSAVLIGAKTNVDGLLWSGAAVLLIALIWMLTYALTEIKDQ